MTTLAQEAKAILSKEKAAATRREKARKQALLDSYAQWITQRTGITPEFAEYAKLATIDTDPMTEAGRAGEAVVRYRTLPLFRIEDVTVAYDSPDECIKYVCQSKEGVFLGPPVHVSRTLTEESPQEKRAKLVHGLVRAMKDAPMLHPVEVLREREAVCPACGREW